MNFFQKIVNYAELMRFKNAAMAGFATLIATIIANACINPGIEGFIELISGSYVLPNKTQLKLMSVFLMVFLATGGGNALNDFYDIEIDKINRPKRVLPSGRIKPKNAYIFAYSCFTIALILGFAINPFSGVIGVINVIVMIFYALVLKKTPLLGNLSVSFLVGTIFLFGGSFFGFEGIKIMIPLFLVAFFVTASREIVKDIEDIEGDKAKGASTFPIKCGEKKSAYLAAFFIIPAAICTPLPYIMGYLSIYYLIAIIPVAIGMIYAIYELLIKKDYTKSSKILKISMLVALFSFIAGLF